MNAVRNAEIQGIRRPRTRMPKSDKLGPSRWGETEWERKMRACLGAGGTTPKKPGRREQVMKSA